MLHLKRLISRFKDDSFAGIEMLSISLGNHPVAEGQIDTLFAMNRMQMGNLRCVATSPTEANTFRNRLSFYKLLSLNDDRLLSELHRFALLTAHGWTPSFSRLWLNQI